MVLVAVTKNPKHWIPIWKKVKICDRHLSDDQERQMSCVRCQEKTNTDGEATFEKTKNKCFMKCKDEESCLQIDYPYDMWFLRPSLNYKNQIKILQMKILQLKLDNNTLG